MTVAAWGAPEASVQVTRTESPGSWAATAFRSLRYVVTDVPPSEVHRHRMLRRAGIDLDLATIIEMALDPDPRAATPTLARYRHPKVELALLRVLGAAQDVKVRRPGQFSHER